MVFAVDGQQGHWLLYTLSFVIMSDASLLALTRESDACLNPALSYKRLNVHPATKYYKCYT